MKEWFVQFWKKHGERNFYLGWTTLYGVCFVFTGVHWETQLGDKSGILVGAGITLLIGAAQLCFNKARSPEKENGK